jgi:hypothetical protein
VAQLLLGQRIVFPANPPVPRGAHTGTLVGAIRFEGGPVPPPGHPRRPVSGTVVLFDTLGKLLARFTVKTGHYFRLRLTPGRYLLIDDLEGVISCGDVSAHVHPNQTVQVTLAVGCGIP